MSQVRISAAAQTDLDDIWFYIAADSPVNADRFPKRVRLGNGPRSRVGWIESEVMEWLQKRIDERNIPTDTSV